MNRVSVSSICHVKTDYIFLYGHLTLYNSKLAITPFLSHKISIKDDDTSSDCNYSQFPINTNIDFSPKEENNFPIFFIDFNLVTCQLIIHKIKQKFKLIVLGANFQEKDYNNDKDFIRQSRIVTFKMPEVSQKTFRLVCESINKSIILSNGYRNNIFSINIRKNFCKEYFINYKDFSSKANTGDILLFRGHANDSKLQRAFTNADYDHVAILYRKNNILYVYESTGKEGVKLRPWQEFINYLWYLLYEKMAFRSLNITEERMKKYIYEENNNNKINSKIIKEKFYLCLNKKVNDFIEHTEDRKYSFSKTGYICTSSMKNNTINRKGYSCSELIAACYFYSGIISDKLEASNYLPGNFSRKGKIAFKSGFYSGEEYIIDFSSSS